MDFPLNSRESYDYPCDPNRQCKNPLWASRTFHEEFTPGHSIGAPRISRTKNPPTMSVTPATTIGYQRPR